MAECNMGSCKEGKRVNEEEYYGNIKNEKQKRLCKKLP